jgi:DNA polymerase/3'-5' exonuclease PolX
MKVGLFDDGDIETDPRFVKVVDSLLPGRGKATGKYCCRGVMFNGVAVNVDIFMTIPEQWGTVLAIRTGSADFAHYSLAKRWVKQGWRSSENVLSDGEGNEKTFSEEEEMFTFLGMPWIRPEDRDAMGEKDKREYYESKGAKDVPF